MSLWISSKRFPDAWNIRCHNRFSIGHGFNQCKRTAFLEGRGDHQVNEGEDLPNLFLIAGEEDVVCDSQRPGQFDQRTLKGAFPNNP